MSSGDILRAERAANSELGQKAHLTGMEVEVTELTDDGRPAVAVFRFDKPLEDESFRWLKWGYGQYEPYTPPAVGQTEIIKAGRPSLR